MSDQISFAWPEMDNESWQERFRLISDLVEKQRFETAKNAYLQLDQDLTSKAVESSAEHRILLLINYCMSLGLKEEELFSKEKFNIKNLAVDRFLNRDNHKKCIDIFEHMFEILKERIFLLNLSPTWAVPTKDNPNPKSIDLEKEISRLSASLEKCEILELISTHDIYLDSIEKMASQQMDFNSQIVMFYLGIASCGAVLHRRISGLTQTGEKIMTQLSKPSFPPGQVLPGGSKILKRVDKQQFVEVFLLDSGEYLYLFHDEEIIKKLKNRNISHEILFAGGLEIIGKRYPDHKAGDILERLKNLIQRRGLDAIAGMSELKKTLIRDVIQPFLNWEAYEKYGVTPSNGILFFGPPGCGKTFIAKKLAEALRAELIEMSEGTVGSPYVHATSNNIVQAFRKAEQLAPCVLFVDEISGLMPRRDGLSSCEQYREAEISEFLMHMEGSVKKKVLVVGATNFPERIDPAILRSGRMDKRIFIPPPDMEARRELFHLLLEERPVSDDIDIDVLAKMTEGLISSDLKLIANNAALKALQGNALISMDLLVEEASQFKPSLSQADLNKYLEFATYHRG